MLGEESLLVSLAAARAAGAYLRPSVALLSRDADGRGSLEENETIEVELSVRNLGRASFPDAVQAVAPGKGWRCSPAVLPGPIAPQGSAAVTLVCTPLTPADVLDLELRAEGSGDLVGAASLSMASACDPGSPGHGLDPVRHTFSRRNVLTLAERRAVAVTPAGDLDDSPPAEMLRAETPRLRRPTE